MFKKKSRQTTVGLSGPPPECTDAFLLTPQKFESLQDPELSVESAGQHFSLRSHPNLKFLLGFWTTFFDKIRPLKASFLSKRIDIEFCTSAWSTLLGGVQIASTFKRQSRMVELGHKLRGSHRFGANAFFNHVLQDFDVQTSYNKVTRHNTRTMVLRRGASATSKAKVGSRA